MMFLAIGVLLASARVMGELARMLRQPAVLGEILAGILLGPTLLGALAPRFTASLFPAAGPNAIILNGLTTLSVTLFMLVAGLELDLSTIWRQGRTAISVSVMGIIIPFALGFILAWLIPQYLGHEGQTSQLIFMLFFATALSISALPVIVKTLIDLNLYRSDLGMIVVASAIFDDLTGWIIFAVILGVIGTSANPAVGITMTIWLTLGYAAFMLTVGRWLIDKILPWIQAYTSWPGGVLGFAISLALLSAAFTEWIGVHAIFGAFLVGIAIGDSDHLREQTRTTIRQFVSSIFAPLFFASIGLRVNFLAQFDWSLTLVVLIVACLGKVLGCGFGAWSAGMAPRESWAVGFGMNARGAMEIILGLLALQYGVISERLFVALVIMALVTSLMSGPAMQRLLKSKQPRRLIDFLSAKTFITRLQATSCEAAILELAHAVAAQAGLPGTTIAEAVWEREQLMSTAMENGLAVPHAKLPGLSAPVIGMGFSEQGIDFDSPDGEPARIIFLILTPLHDNGAQLEVLADIAKTFANHEIHDKALQVAGYVQFLAMIKSESHAA